MVDSEEPSWNPWLVLVVLSMGFFMILLDTTIVNIAIPSIVDALNASLDQILWVINAYILVYAVLLITAGRLGDLYGQRNMFALGLALFTVASASCGLAQDTSQLIVARVAQGVGGALLTPQTLAMLTRIFPPHSRGAAFGVWGAVAGVASVAGPTLGGFIVTNWSWRWIFYVNLPIGVLTLVATFLVVPDLRQQRRHRLDVVGVALSTLGLLGIVFGLIEGQRFDWGAVWGPITIPEIVALGVLLTLLFFVWEARQQEPLIPLSLFGDRNFSVMNWISAVLSFAILGVFLPFTIYLQSALGMTALQAGLTVAPQAIVSMVLAPIAGRLADRTGGKYVLLVGLLLFAGGWGLIMRVAGPDTTALDLLPSLILSGIGMGLIFAPISTIAMREVNPRMAGAASGVLNTTRQLGGVVGSAVVGAVLQNRLATAVHDEALAYAAQLPVDVRQRFVDALTAAMGGGLEIGRSQTEGSQLPAGIPPQVAQQLQQAFHDVFLRAYLDAMRPSLAVPIVALLVAALSTLAIGRGQGARRGQPRQPEEPLAHVA